MNDELIHGYELAKLDFIKLISSKHYWNAQFVVDFCEEVRGLKMDDSVEWGTPAAYELAERTLKPKEKDGCEK